MCVQTCMLGFLAFLASQSKVNAVVFAEPLPELFSVAHCLLLLCTAWVRTSEGKDSERGGLVFYACSQACVLCKLVGERTESTACHLLMLYHHVFHIPGPTFYCQLVPLFLKGLTCRSVGILKVASQTCSTFFSLNKYAISCLHWVPDSSTSLERVLSVPP